MSTSHPYVPMPDGGRIDYIVREITGLWHPENGFLDVITRNQIDNQRISWSTINTNFGNLTASYRHLQTTPDMPVIWNSTLKDGMCVLPSGKHYYGEWGSWQGLYVTPAECKITLYPIVGEIVDQISSVFLGENTSTVLYQTHWIYRTLSFLTTWGPLTGDMVRTSLYELDGQMVYNYIYMKDVGLVAFWYGQLSPSNNTVVGYEKRMII